MTLKQMEYVMMTAKCSSFNEAARRLYISQPSLSESIKKLERELDVVIFHRKRFGVSLTEEGQKLLGAIQSILDQVQNIEKIYEHRKKETLEFGAAAIRFYFMNEIYADLAAWLEEQNLESYELKLQDEETLEVIDDVVNGNVEIGVITYTDHSRSQIMNKLKTYRLEHHDLISSRMWAYMGPNHPLLKQKSVTMKDLEIYPYISVQQTRSKDFFFTEEGIFFPANTKKIYVRDVSDLCSIVQKTNAFVMGTGAQASDVSEKEIAMIQVADAPVTTICWICRSGYLPSVTGQKFIDLMTEKLKMIRQ